MKPTSGISIHSKIKDGKRHDLAQPLSRIESEVAPLFRAINDGYHRFHLDDFEGLTIFMALLWVRGPFGRDFVSGLSAQVMKHVRKKCAEDAAQFARKYEEFLNASGAQRIYPPRKYEPSS